MKLKVDVSFAENSSCVDPLVSASEASILAVDDDPVILEYIRLHLSTADFDVRIALSVQAAMAAITERRPDIILSDISMPNVDGFDFLLQLRANPLTKNISFIFLTQHTEIATMRRGMQLGANDFLSKPIRRAELLKAITGRLKILQGMRREASVEAVPTLGLAVVGRGTNDAADAASEHTASDHNHTQLINVSAKDGLSDGNWSASSQRLVDGTILFADIRNFVSIAEKLNANEVAELLNAFFAMACEPILAQRGWVVKFIGDGVVAMFDQEGAVGAHQERALKAALLMTLAAQQFQSWIDRRHADRQLPPFAIGVGLHCGTVSVASMGSGPTAETTVLGDVVNLASRMEATTKEFGWSIAASAEVMLAAGERFVIGRSGQVKSTARRALVEQFEVIGLLQRAGETPSSADIYARIADAVTKNTALVAALRPLKTSRTHSGAITTDVVDDVPNIGGAAIRLDGYRLLKKLGQGGMSQVYLAENIADGAQHVLKLIRIDASETGETQAGEILQRFISEYALISQIDHPNVAKIFHQGFSESHAFIAMEYFPGGDLRQLLAGVVGETIAVATLLQVAGALAAIHELGIVHRDMKPDNIMIRADGSMALADFGIATQSSTWLHTTAAGEVYGTPSYISPEQVTDSAVDQRADIYALGVMFFELLTGKKPYRATSPQAILYQHANAPVPTLPEPVAHFQSLLDRMMAKDPQDRFHSADVIIDAVLSISPPDFV